MNPRGLALLSLALLVSVDAMADIPPPKPASPIFDPAPFTHLRKVTSPPQNPGLYRLAADPDLLRHSGVRHRFLHLVKREGETLVEIPWVMRHADAPRPPQDERVVSHHIESFGKRIDGSIEITVNLEAGSVSPVRLEIDTPLHDFEKGVAVSVLAPDGTWAELVGDGVIFDHSRFLDFRHTGLTLPATKARQFRIHVSDATDEQRSLVKQLSRTVGDSSGLTVSESSTVTTRAFRIDSIRFLSAPAMREERDRSQLSLDLEILEPPVTEEGQTRLVLDGGNAPLNRLLLSTGDRNFRRAVSLQVPDATVAGSWRTIHRTHVHRYEVGSFHDESLGLAFHATRADRYRLLVENGDNPPLVIESVSGSGPAYELVFVAEGGELPLLYLGSSAETLTNPSLDTAAIEAALRRGVKAELLELGALADNPLFRAESAAVPENLLESKTALWIIIAFAVAVLIAVLYRALRQIEAVKEDS